MLLPSEGLDDSELLLKTTREKKTTRNLKTRLNLEKRHQSFTNDIRIKKNDTILSYNVRVMKTAYVEKTTN